MAFVLPLSISVKSPFISSTQSQQKKLCVGNTTIYIAPFSLASSNLNNEVVKMGVEAPAVFKQALLEKVMPLDFGRTIADSPRLQEEIEQLTKQVEATNKSTNPSADPNLSARWLCKYTTSSSILRINLPKFLQPVEIIQYIDAANLKAKNEEVFKIGPFTFTNAVEAKLTARSNSLFDVDFVQFILFGFFKFNVEKNPKFKGFLEITYLDQDLRISRGNRGNLFILVRDQSVTYP